MPAELGAIKAARQRMLDADGRKNARGNAKEAWDKWQRAAVDYWELLHADLHRLRRGDQSRVLTVDEMRELGEGISDAMHGIPESWRLNAPSGAKIEHLARVGWWHQLMAALYEPIERAVHRAADDPAAVETLFRFLEADVYCHRSGYMKADAARALKRLDLDEPSRDRVRSIVLTIVDGPDRREFRSFVRLATAVDSALLRVELRRRRDEGDPRTRRHATWVLEGLGERSDAA